MEERFSRTSLVIGDVDMEKIFSSSVIVFGVGGVGGAAVEALARAGVGHIAVVDPDTVSVSNINRQLFATDRTVGKNKCDAAEERIHEINPGCRVDKYPVFWGEDNKDEIVLTDFDGIIDAVDTVSSKLLLAEIAYKNGIYMISSMGTGNKTDPTGFRVTDISKTNTCPLAAVVRRECRKRGIKKLDAVWSDEIPKKAVADEAFGKHAPGSVSFVPPVAGMIAAGEMIKHIISSGTESVK